MRRWTSPRCGRSSRRLSAKPGRYCRHCTSPPTLPTRRSAPTFLVSYRTDRSGFRGGCDMASITYWNRLEPDPRSKSLARSLAAEIRDPAWLLTRQWQLGEFQGEDAATPMSVEIETETFDLTTFGPVASPTPLPPGVPL